MSSIQDAVAAMTPPNGNAYPQFSPAIHMDPIADAVDTDVAAAVSALLTADELAAINGAATPAAGNVFATMADVPLTTKGDLLTFSTLNARIPVGLNGQVLVPDSTLPLGLKWGESVDNQGSVGVTTFLYDTNSVDVNGDFISIGGLKFEFLDAGSDVTADDSIGVLIAGSAELTFANFLAALNGAYSGPGATGILLVGGVGAALENNTTINVVGDLISTTQMRVKDADAPGGTHVVGAGTYDLAETMNAGTNIWEQGSVNMSTLSGREPGQSAATTVAITTAMLTNGFRVAFPFTVVGFNVLHLDSTGAPVIAAAIATATYTIDSGDLLVTPAGIVPFTNGDTLHVTAWA